MKISAKKSGAIDAELIRLSGLINEQLGLAHKHKLSVSCETNGFLQLQESELLQVHVEINKCEHLFETITTVEQSAKTSKSHWSWRFQRCNKCGQTRNHSKENK